MIISTLETVAPPIEKETGPHPHYTVIWLHGLGSDGRDFVPVADQLGLEADAVPDVRFIFPHAPRQAVTCHGGYVLPAWYDIYALERMRREIDEEGLLSSCAMIRALIEREISRGIPACRIFLAGFSQGGAVASFTALTHHEPLAGLIALSTYLPALTRLDAMRHPANHTLPIFAAHGQKDDVVDADLGRLGRDFLVQYGYSIDWQEFPIGHTVSPAEIKALGRWLRQHMEERTAK